MVAACGQRHEEGDSCYAANKAGPDSCKPPLVCHLDSTTDSNGRCYTVADADQRCASSDQCRLEGLCGHTSYMGSCAPTSGADCQKTTWCKSEGKCRYEPRGRENSGFCVK